MSKQISLSEENYREFQAALLLTSEEEETVINRLVKEYARGVFEGVIKTNSEEPIPTFISPNEQKRQFVAWFSNLTRNGKLYNPVTISGYTSRLENACTDQVFDEVSINNVFVVTKLSEFLDVQKQIKSCAGYDKFDEKTHNGFTAALRKYEEFLQYKEGGMVTLPSIKTRKTYTKPSNVHRWTMQEDILCCKAFLQSYVIDKSSIDITDFLEALSKKVPDVTEGSLRMKIQNIKYLAHISELKDTSKLTWLNQYSLQCKTAFEQVKKEFNL